MQAFYSSNSDEISSEEHEKLKEQMMRIINKATKVGAGPSTEKYKHAVHESLSYILEYE